MYKRQPRSRRGIFLGFSPDHSSLVSLVLNNTTHSITGQYHTVIDDRFTTVSTPNDAIDPAEWLDLLKCRVARVNFPFYVEDNPATRADSNDPIPVLSDEWLSPSERETRANDQRQTAVQENHPATASVERGIQPELSSSNLDDNAVSLHAHDQITVESPVESEEPTEREESSPPQVPPPAPPSVSAPNPPQQRQVCIADPPDNRLQQQSPSATVESIDSAINASNKSEVEPETVPPLRRSSQNRTRRQLYDPGSETAASRWTDRSINALQASINKLKATTKDLRKLQAHMAQVESTMLEHNHQPYALASKKMNDPNLPSLRASLIGDEAEFYWKAMKKEIEDLEKRNTWVYVNRDSLPAGTFVVPTLWAQRKKLTPSGELKKYKSRITCRGDLMKKHGVEPLDTFSPVCMWSSVRLILTLTLLLGLKTESIDFSNAFVQADIPQGTNIYLEPPIGFDTPKPNQALKLQKSLYGTSSAPRLWYEKIDKGLLDRGFKRSRIDPCLYCLLYTSPSPRD